LPALPALAALLRAEDITLRKSAVLGLSEVEDPQSLAILGEGLADPDPGVRAAAAWAIGRLGLPEGRALLEPRRGAEQDPAVLKAVTSALGRLAESNRTEPVP